MKDTMNSSTGAVIIVGITAIWMKCLSGLLIPTPERDF